MEFVDFLASCSLMQAINILRDHTAEFSFLLTLCKLEMRYIWLITNWQHPFPVESIEIFGIHLKEAAADDAFRWELKLQVIKSVNTAKITDA